MGENQIRGMILECSGSLWQRANLKAGSGFHFLNQIKKKKKVGSTLFLRNERNLETTKILNLEKIQTKGEWINLSWEELLAICNEVVNFWSLTKIYPQGAVNVKTFKEEKGHWKRVYLAELRYSRIYEIELI